MKQLKEKRLSCKNCKHYDAVFNLCDKEHEKLRAWYCDDYEEGGNKMIPAKDVSEDTTSAALPSVPVPLGKKLNKRSLKEMFELEESPITILKKTRTPKPDKKLSAGAEKNKSFILSVAKDYGITTMTNADIERAHKRAAGAGKENYYYELKDFFLN